MADSRARTGGKFTPVMQQYLDIKSRYQDAVLFFRMGDFYEMFFEDAEKASTLLDIALTSRNRNEENPIPMCGVPFHSARGYIAKLLEAGVKVAICEQLELPRRGLARREVTRVVTPGTTLDEESLAPDRSNYLAAAATAGDGWAIAWMDFSTGEISYVELPNQQALEDELSSIAPSEVLVDATVDAQVCARLVQRSGAALSLAADVVAGDQEGEQLPAGVGAETTVAARRALSRLLSYVRATQGEAIDHLRSPRRVESDRYVRLDEATRRNLEIVESREGKRAGSLLDTVDGSVTPMGKRLLRRWLLHPLAEAPAIGQRLDAIEWLVEDVATRSDLLHVLREIGDLERLSGRVGSRSAGPRDLSMLAEALTAVGRLRELLERTSLPSLVGQVLAEIDPLEEVARQIRSVLADEPPAVLGRGDVIRGGYHEEVDRLRSIRSGGKDWMAEFESAERRRTGLGNLKVGYNKVFGYFISVSRAAHDRVPSEYERKQTLANAERYVTPELKRREAEVLGAEERLATLERHLFEQAVTDVAAWLGKLGRTAAGLAVLDVLAGLAETAHRGGHVRPEIVREGALEISEGRHPVVESVLGSRFVPNDCCLGGEQASLMILTGPNMAGKSTYLRQVALLVLLAHCGCFVPASAARVPLVDRIFTRIGASDNLVRGESTFMVEMTETAAILRNMSDRSLIVLDEIGRGTSTFDGISIAWAVAEAVIKAGAKTLFATHYHELAALADEYDSVANCSVAVRRYRGEVVFLYRVVAGATSGSYGIEVARLAGVPEPVIETARRMLVRFEAGQHLTSEGIGSQQGSLFDPPTAAAPSRPEDGLSSRLAELDIEGLRPLDALNVLAELVEEARRRQ